MPGAAVRTGLKHLLRKIYLATEHRNARMLLLRSLGAESVESVEDGPSQRTAGHHPHRSPRIVKALDKREASDRQAGHIGLPGEQVVLPAVHGRYRNITKSGLKGELAGRSTVDRSTVDRSTVDRRTDSSFPVFPLVPTILADHRSEGQRNQAVLHRSRDLINRDVEPEAGAVCLAISRSPT
eukprot:scaffold940_cov262-Pinguiococcus_pyrenoidosus.AAC.4